MAGWTEVLGGLVDRVTFHNRTALQAFSTPHWKITGPWTMSLRFVR